MCLVKLKSFIQYLKNVITFTMLRILPFVRFREKSYCAVLKMKQGLRFVSVHLSEIRLGKEDELSYGRTGDAKKEET